MIIDMEKIQKHVKTLAGFLFLSLAAQNASAAIALDRTRVVFNADKNAMSVTVSNQNKSLPYLAQSWVENADGQKVESPLAALPPLQRIEPGEKGQIKIQATGNVSALPQDRESLFYFNVREIPPKSSKPNTLQLALQTRVKMFFRPSGIVLLKGDSSDIIKKVTLTQKGNGYELNNPTPYYVTIVAASTSANAKEIDSFKPVMVAPKSNLDLGVSAAALGSHPTLTYVNDFGGRPKMVFNCSGNTCTVGSINVG